LDRGGKRKLNNEETDNLYFSTNIITVIKASRLGLVGNVAGMEEVINA
jgi:hypothetical protein